MESHFITVFSKDTATGKENSSAHHSTEATSSVKVSLSWGTDWSQLDNVQCCMQQLLAGTSHLNNSSIIPNVNDISAAVSNLLYGAIHNLHPNKG